MYCQCPGCQRTTQIQPEQLDHLVRCDRCRILFIARTSESIELAEQLAAELAVPAPPGPDHIHLAEILSRNLAPRVTAAAPAAVHPPADPVPAADNSLTTIAEEQRLVEEVRQRDARSGRQKELARFQLRWQRHALGIIGLCGLAALVLLTCLVLLLNNHLRQASASPGLHPTPDPAAAPAAQTQAAPTAEPAIDANAQSSGELFPAIKSSN